jgi:hypothetical protein
MCPHTRTLYLPFQTHAHRISSHPHAHVSPSTAVPHSLSLRRDPLRDPWRASPLLWRARAARPPPRALLRQPPPASLHRAPISPRSSSLSPPTTGDHGGGGHGEVGLHLLAAEDPFPLPAAASAHRRLDSAMGVAASMDERPRSRVRRGNLDP